MPSEVRGIYYIKKILTSRRDVEGSRRVGCSSPVLGMTGNSATKTSWVLVLLTMAPWGAAP